MFPWFHRVHGLGQVLKALDVKSGSDGMVAMSKFAHKWGVPDDFKTPSGPLKPRIEAAIRIIRGNAQRLEQKLAGLAEKDKMLFDKIVKFYEKSDVSRAKIYASELAEIRKMMKTVMASKLALEQIAERLSTVRDFGDIMVTLMPAIKVVRDIRGGVYTVAPEADRTFAGLASMLDELIADARQTAEVTVSAEYANEEAKRILEEARAVAEQKLKERIPQVPEEAVAPGGEAVKA